MSRVGNNPISIPEGVSIEVNKDIITVKGKNGEMNQAFDGVSFDISADENAYLLIGVPTSQRTYF